MKKQPRRKIDIMKFNRNGVKAKIKNNKRNNINCASHNHCRTSYISKRKY